MDSIRRCIVLFKPVTIPTSDPKSEFLCQSSHSCAEPTDPLNTSYAWDISHALVTTYHPYCHNPSAPTEYLKQKLHHQRAKHLGHSPSTQVEQNVPLERNIDNTKNKQEVNSRLRRLMARLEAEGLTNGAMSHDREPPPRHQPAKMYPLAPSPMPPHCHMNYVDATTSTPADM